jgi:hypothetical protein
MQNLQTCCCKHDGKYLWKKQPIYLSLLTSPNFHLLVSESIQISNWCEPDPLTNWLVGWLLVCLFVDLQDLTIVLYQLEGFWFLVSFSVSSSLISMHWSFTSSNTQVLGKFSGVMMLHHTVDLWPWYYLLFA